MHTIILHSVQVNNMLGDLCRPEMLHLWSTTLLNFMVYLHVFLTH